MYNEIKGKTKTKKSYSHENEVSLANYFIDYLLDVINNLINKQQHIPSEIIENDKSMYRGQVSGNELLELSIN